MDRSQTPTPPLSRDYIERHRRTDVPIDPDGGDYDDEREFGRAIIDVILARAADHLGDAEAPVVSINDLKVELTPVAATATGVPCVRICVGNHCIHHIGLGDP